AGVAEQGLRHPHPHQPGDEGSAHDAGRDAAGGGSDRRGPEAARGRLRSSQECVMKSIVAVAVGLNLVLVVPVAAQLGQLGKVLQKGQDATKDLVITDDDERQIGADISAKLREKYGVVQDPAVHKYVTLVGTVLASNSSRSTLKWTFIVLDTDGVNAFAAPGGFIHITRGALALIQNEAELADVLAHEISHVTEKHTINAIKKEK